MAGRALALAFLLIALAPAAARAESYPEIRRLHLDGDYLAAAERGKRVGTAEALALAANALSVHGFYVAPPGEQEPFFREAVRLVDDAERTVRRARLDDPALLALIAFQKGQAYGRLAEVLPIQQRPDYADVVRVAFEKAIELKPDYWQSHVGLGRWHAQATLFAREKAGGFGGFVVGVLFGASFEKAEGHRAAAAAVERTGDPQKIFLTESADIRLIIDPEENLEAARRDLEVSLAMPAHRFLAQVAHRRATDCLQDMAACAAQLRARTLE